MWAAGPLGTMCATHNSSVDGYFITQNVFQASADGCPLC